MASYPLVTEQTEEGAELVAKLRQHVRVDAAFWLNPSEDGSWTLCIASPEFDSHDYHHPYLEAHRILREMQTPNIDLLQLRVIGTNDPMTQAAIAINRKYPGRASRVRGSSFGGRPVEEVYIYPGEAVTTPI